MAQPGTISYGGAGSATGNPYDSGAYYGSVDYGGAGLMGSTTSMLAYGPTINISTLTHKWSGKPFGGWSGVNRWLTGKNSDIMTARKLAGVTTAGMQYSNLVGKTGRFGASLGRIAPTLSHLGPAKFFTLWSALSGNEDAMKSLAVMSEMRTGARAARGAGETLGQAYTRTYRKRAGYTFGRDARNVAFADREVYAGGARFGSIFDGTSDTFKSIKRTIDGLQSGGGGSAILMRDAGYLDGAATKLYAPAMAKLASNQGIAGQLFRGGGKMIKPVSGIAGKAFVGVDLYGIASFVGGMGAKGVIGALSAPMNYYNALTAEMHRGMFMSSSPLSPVVGATGRQRAMSNIYEKQLNLRQVLGNEAPYLANWGL